MKANNILISVLALSLAAGACTRVDESLLMDKAGNNTVEITINCPVSQDDPTRTDIQGLNPVWKAGDEIWLSDGVDAVSATIPKEYDGMSYAKVSVSGLRTDSTFYALYPYQDSAYVYNETIYAWIPANQDGTFAKAHLAVGVCQPGNDRHIEFKNACAVLKFTTFREDIAGLQIQNTSANFSGEFRIDPATGQKKSNGNSFRRICLPYGSRNTGEKYVSMMESSFPKGAKLTFISRDGRMGYIYTSVKNTLENGYLYDLGDIDDAITMDATPATDLGEAGTANCYIVNGGGSYRFAAVEGNSKKELENVAYADVVWETVNTSTAPSKFSMASEVAYCEGYVYVRIPENAPDGNILVSVNDEYGNILWSWHIWILKNGLTDQTWPSGAVMMDRNLGALNATPGNVLANGLLYQWGRKDPFMGIGKFKTSTAMTAAGTGISNVARNEDNGSVEYATTHPTHFIYKNEGDWTDDDLELWSASKKTKYDPCPPGYHVPFESVFEGMTADNVVYDETNYGRKMTYESQQIWFPFAGRKQSGTGGVNLGYSSNPMFYLFYDQNSSESASCSWVGTSSTLVFGGNAYQKCHSSGFSVRCQKIVSSGITNTIKLKYNVEDLSYGVKAPSFTGESYSDRFIDWGDGTTERLDDLEPKFYHFYGAPGAYSLVLTVMDATSITVPIGDLTEIDVTGF